MTIDQEIAALKAIAESNANKTSGITKGYIGYRYLLVRPSSVNLPPVDQQLAWLMLNPSTADHIEDDATIRKCTGFTKRWGYHAFGVSNLFALRSTDPTRLLLHIDPVGKYNDDHIQSLNYYNKIIIAWGGFGKTKLVIQNRITEVMKMLDPKKLYCIGKNKDGSPQHPCMAKYTSGPIRWQTSGDEEMTYSRLGLIKV